MVPILLNPKLQTQFYFPKMYQNWHDQTHEGISSHVLKANLQGAKNPWLLLLHTSAVNLLSLTQRGQDGIDKGKVQQ